MTFKNPIIFILFLFLGQNNIQGQTKELDDYHLKQKEYYKHINNDSLIYYSKKLQLSKDPCVVYSSYIVESKGHYSKGNYRLAEKLSKKVLRELTYNNNFCQKRNKISALNRLFWIKKNENQFQEAFKFLIDRKRIVDNLEIKDSYYSKSKMRVKIDMASIKSIMDLNNEAINILKNTYKEYESILKDNPFEEASILNSIGDSYYKISKDSIPNYLDSAGVFYTKSFDLTEKFRPLHKNSESIYNLRMAELAILKEDYKTAIYYLKKHKNIEEEHQTQQRYYYLKSIYNYYTKNIDSSLYYSKKYLYTNQFGQPNKKKDLIKMYNILTEIYFNKKQTDSAFKYSKLTLESIKNYNNSKATFNNKYHAHDHNKIKELNKSILEKEANKKFQLIGLLLFIIGIFSFIIRKFYKANQKKSKKLADYISKENQPKKEYNIDKTLKDEILKNLNKFEKSTDYLDSDFTIQVLSEKLNTNTSYLSSIINSTKNQTFKQYIIDLKINYLIHKLKTEKKYRNYSIQALGQEIGYTNASSFTRSFKKLMKSTPSQYIKSLDEI